MWYDAQKLLSDGVMKFTKAVRFAAGRSGFYMPSNLTLQNLPDKPDADKRALVGKVLKEYI